MNIHEFIKYMTIASVLFLLTIGIIGYAMYKKDYSDKMHRLILGSFFVDIIGLIIVIVKICY